MGASGMIVVSGSGKVVLGVGLGLELLVSALFAQSIAGSSI